jgi:hypothetical protein
VGEEATRDSLEAEGLRGVVLGDLRPHMADLCLQWEEERCVRGALDGGGGVWPTMDLVAEGELSMLLEGGIEVRLAVPLAVLADGTSESDSSE